jgi:hypothetical protein
MNEQPARGLDCDVLLKKVRTFLDRFVSFTNHYQADAVTLWIAHTHVFGAAETTPRLAIQSPEKRSGKTRLLEVLEFLVAEPIRACEVSESYLFRRIEKGPVTLLLDEVDAIFGWKAHDREGLRSLLNVGYRIGAKVGRCDIGSKALEPRDFSAFCPVALAGIGGLPDTIEDRAIVLTLRRQAPDERCERFRFRLVAYEAGELQGCLASWGSAAVQKLADAWPALPDELDDRRQDCWELLLAIADLAGGSWPDRARAAAVALSGTAVVEEASRGIQLLGDIKGAFGKDSRLPSKELVRRLCDLEEAEWGDDQERLDVRRLAKWLKPFRIHPGDHKFDDKTLKGYEAVQFTDSWNRYLGATAATSATPKPSNGTAVADVAPVADTDDLGAWCSDTGAVHDRARHAAAEASE